MSDEDKGNEKDKQQEVAEALAEISKDTITIGETKYKVYPVALGKIILLQPILSQIAPIMNVMKCLTLGNDEEALKQWESDIVKAADNVIDAFHILTSPNNPDGFIPELSDDDRNKLKNTMTTDDFWNVIFYLNIQTNYAHLLKKNVPAGIKEVPEKKRAGQVSSVGSSN